MTQAKLSYLIATRNKLRFLRHSLPRLLAHLQGGDEVIVVDGASTDGTAEYLAGLHAAGKVHQLVSEPDKGESHAFNKGLLMARGEVIKPLSDDDVFHYPTIQRCRDFMLANPDVDAVVSDGGFATLGRSEAEGVSMAAPSYDAWTRHGRPFMFSGLSELLRRSSLPLLGMYHTGIIGTDEEYSRRLTSLPVCLGWCTGLTFVHLRTPAGNGAIHGPRTAREVERIKAFYECPDPPPPWLNRMAGRARPLLRPLKRLLRPPRPAAAAAVDEKMVAQTMERMNEWLDRQNRGLPCTFRAAARGTAER
jgi:glycosyltransferase involved in cell wall biosynthesis